MRTAVTMVLGGIAYSAAAVAINYALRGYGIDGDTKLAFFFIGFGIVGKYMHDREQSLYF